MSLLYNTTGSHYYTQHSNTWFVYTRKNNINSRNTLKATNLTNIARNFTSVSWRKRVPHLYSAGERYIDSLICQSSTSCHSNSHVHNHHLEVTYIHALFNGIQPSLSNTFAQPMNQRKEIFDAETLLDQLNFQQLINQLIHRGRS